MQQPWTKPDNPAQVAIHRSKHVIILVAHYRTKAGLGDRVVAALKLMADAVVRHEPGCLNYTPSRALNHPEVFVLYEQYASHAALDTHRASKHFQTIIEGIVAPLLEERTVRQYTPLVENGELS
jgi:quinol monooxygenase YgiN